MWRSFNGVAGSGLALGWERTWPGLASALTQSWRDPKQKKTFIELWTNTKIYQPNPFKGLGFQESYLVCIMEFFVFLYNLSCLSPKQFDHDLVV